MKHATGPVSANSFVGQSGYWMTAGTALDETDVKILASLHPIDPEGKR